MKKAEVGKHYMDVDKGFVYVGVRDSVYTCQDESVALINVLSGSIYSYDTSFGRVGHGEFVEVEVKVHWTKKPVEPESGIYEK